MQGLNVRVGQRIMSVKQEDVLMALIVCGPRANCARLTVDIADIRVEIQVEEEWATMQPVVMCARRLAQCGYVHRFLGGLNFAQRVGIIFFFLCGRECFCDVGAIGISRLTAI